jgi:hypothetical protein
MENSSNRVTRSDIVAAGVLFVQLYDDYLLGENIDWLFAQARARFRGQGFSDAEVEAALEFAARIFDGRAAVTDQVQ